MKTLIVLYELVLERFKANNSNPKEVTSNSYICNNIHELHDDLIITKYEHDFICEHFKNEEPSPTKHTTFYEHPLFVGDYIWFSCTYEPDLAYSIRVQLLTNIINNLKDASNQ